MVASYRQSSNLRHGEVIETSTLGFWAESDRLHHLPQLGELVKAGINEEMVVYAVVAFGQTGGIDPGRRAVRRGGEGLSDAEIYAQHPELDHVLRTIFRAAAVGYASGGVTRYSLPPLPVPLHYSVHPCDPDEIRRFAAQPDYFAAMLNFRGEVSPEEILAAHLRWVDEQMGDDHIWLRSAARRLARLMKRDYDRLVTLLESISPDTR